ncbi:MAG: DUF1186 domain-containing protein [Chloroflexota bacterium]|nr:DUF1186 domain-containing protein [Chloroflexota bacterium]
MTPQEIELSETLSELLQAGKEPEQGLLDRVVAFGPATVPALIEMATDETLHQADSESPEVWAPLHAANLLGHLQAAEAVEPLLPLLQMDDDWLAEALPEVYGKIGEPALEPLRAYLFDRTQGVWGRVTAARALKQIGQYHPQTRPRVVDALASRLAPEHSQEPDDEVLNGFIIGYLVDLKATEAMPAIREAYEQDRVDTSIVGELGDVQEDLGLAVESPRRTKPDQGVNLRLRCTCCNYEREHVIQRVYYDLGTAERQKRGKDTERSAVIIPERIKCPKCGSVDQYELTLMAHAAITAEMLKQLAHQEGIQLPAEVDTDGESRVTLLHFALEDGREMHPHAALQMYRAEVEARPENGTLRLRLGNILRVLGYHDEARKQYEEAARLDPQDIEAHYNLATLAEEMGDPAEARQRYERVLELGAGWGLFKGKRGKIVAAAREALAELGVRSGSRHLHTEDGPVLVLPSASPGDHVHSQQPARAGRKVGRNEPCPCGSGKKYKKCHGA